MATLPLIVGVGGINAAGRSSGFHSYKRMVAESLSAAEMQATWRDLGVRMGLCASGSDPDADTIMRIKDGTLVRKIESFDPANAAFNAKVRVEGERPVIVIKKNKLPSQIPPHWQVESLNASEVRVTLMEETEFLLPLTKTLPVSCGANIPRGFNPGDLYDARYHPRGLQLAVYGASDVLNSLGMSWAHILQHISPDQVSVYAGSAIAQIDEYSLAGLVAQPLLGGRVSSKMIALSLAEMPADFINGYIINSIGATGTNMGACASFMYNLRQGMSDIQSGRAKVVIVGAAEAPIVPEIVEGFSVMGALAEDKQLCKLDGVDTLNHRRACRPFSSNAGFTLAEAAQFVVLMDDELALQLGANILGSAAEVFISADANKKSISAPGVGNYVTVAKAAGFAASLLGTQGLQKTYVQAHGTGTPQNRVTESHILNQIAKTFSLSAWPVAAIKSYVGHSVASAGGDQLLAALGAWQYGWLPGIKTIDHIADDVHHSHLNILMQDHFAGEHGEQMQAVFINSKGFGGNNATGVILSPHKTLELLENKYGRGAITDYRKKNTAVQLASREADEKACNGDEKIVYNFGTDMMDEDSVTVTPSSIKLAKFDNEIKMPNATCYQDYC